MTVKYKTIMQQAKETLVIEKSKFIGFVLPVESVEEAEVFIAEIRASHRDATHNVPVYVLGERFEVQKYSDDGEPSGTAGVPILQMLIKEGLTNIAVVVTRYFGGIKLGTGGLVRAYTGTAKEAVKAAGIAEVKDMDVMCMEIQYTYHGKVENLAAKGGFTIRRTEFTDKVTLEVICDPSYSGQLEKEMMEITSGTVKITGRSVEEEKVPVSD